MDGRRITSRYYLLRFSDSLRQSATSKILLNLKAHGIGDGIIEWIEQWLTDRRQSVVVDGKVSNWKTVFIGVPQGSVLEPLIFLTHMNYLDDNIASNVLKFPDDTTVFRRINNDGDKQHLQNKSRQIS